MSTEASVVIKGRNDIAYAVKQAEQQLRGLARTGELIGKVFRGGAIVGAVVAFERLAENAEAAALALGDKGTARSLHLLNAEIDRLKQKGTNIIGKVLGNVYTAFRGDELAKIREQIEFLQRMQGRSFVAAGYGRIGTGYFSAEEGAAKLKELMELERLYAASRPFGERTGSPGGRNRGGTEGDFVKNPPAATRARAEAFAISEEGARAWAEATKRADDYYAEVDYRAELSADLQRSAAGAIGDIADQMEREYEAAAKQNDQMTVYAEQAARNMQDAFANFLFDPFEEGVQGMLKGFVDVIRRMVAEMMASQIFTMLGGALSASGNPFIAGIGALFGGKRAGGGPVSAGKWYTVGERGPETFIPSTSGAIVPAGGGAISLSYSIDARGADADRIMAILPPLLKQSEDRTVARIRDLQDRGRM